MATIFTEKYFFNCAVRDYGHEDPRTIAIGQLVDELAEGSITKERAALQSKIFYNMTLEEYEDLFYYDEEEDDSEMLDMGFNPYMGCYDFDC